MDGEYIRKNRHNVYRNEEKLDVAIHSNLKQELTKLSKDEDWLIRACVARNPNTPVEILFELEKDKNIDVRASLIDNLNISNEILKKLAMDKNPYLRWRVASLLRTIPKRILKKLAVDKDEIIRHKVLKNPGSDDEIKEIVDNTNQLYGYVG